MFWGILLIFVNIILSIIHLINPNLILLENLKYFFYLTNIFIVIGLISKIFTSIVHCFKKYPYQLIQTRYEEIPKEDIKDVFVIIPAYNEEGSIVQAIKNCKEYVNNVIVIDDGSDDTTASISKDAGAIVIQHFTNKGLAQAVKTGINAAIERGAKIIVNFDADMQYDAKDIPSLSIPVLEKKYDLMMGSRLGGTIEKMSILKKCGNIAFSRLIGNITKTYISDGQSGFRAFSAEFGKKIKIRQGFTYTQQMIFEAAEKNFKIGEIPIYFSKRKSGESRLMRGIFHFAIGAWKLILQVFAEYYPLKLFLFLAKQLIGIAFIFANLSLYLLSQNFVFGNIISIYSMLFFLTSVIIACMGLIAETRKE
jgi:glycosyltransferase involved in cell wall biosynthesis